MQLSDDPLRALDEAREREIIPRIVFVHEVMTHPLAIPSTRLGRGQVEAPVNLEGIASDQFAVKRQGQIEGQRRFSGSGGADDRDQRR
jgi:hypothetical protein